MSTKSVPNKKVIIAGSTTLQTEAKHWKSYFESKGFQVIDYPVPIDEKRFKDLYPNVYKRFYQNIENTNLLFVMNEDKNGISGYIGAETFAELVYGVIQNLLRNKDIDIVIRKMPSEEVGGFDEIKLWLELGWIRLYKE